MRGVSKHVRNAMIMPSYDRFTMDELADMLDALVNEGGGPWRDKAAYIKEAMAERGALDTLEEFVAWFPDEDGTETE